MIRRPAATIAAATTRAVIESKAAIAGDLDQREADQHPGRGERVGAQVGGVALQRRRVVGPRLAREDRRDARLATHREAHHGDADAERFDLGADDQPVGRLVDDDPGADQDQHPLDRRRQVLDLLVPVGMLGVGRLVGFADRDEGDHRGDQVDQRVDRLGEDRDRAGDRPGRELDRDQRSRWRRSRAPRRRFWCGSSPVRAAPAAARCAASSRAARPRWLISFFSARAELRHRALRPRGRCRRGRRPGRSRSRPLPRGARRSGVPRSGPRRRARRRPLRSAPARRRRRRGARPPAAPTSRSSFSRFSSSLAPSPP